MINYSIDPSIFNLPDNLLEDHLIQHYDKIKKIENIMNTEGINVFLFNCTRIIFDDDLIKKNCNSQLPIDSLKTVLNKFQNYYFPDPNSRIKGPKGKYQLFEDYFKLNEPKYDTIKILSDGQKDDMFKIENNIVKIGILNNIIYKNYLSHFLLSERTMDYAFECRDINFEINGSSSQKDSFTFCVSIKNITEIITTNDDIFKSVLDVYRNAKTKFGDYIIFGKDVEKGINNTIRKNSGPPNRIYYYLETLKDFCIYKRKNETLFFDDYIVRALGCDCVSDEGKDYMESKAARNDRLYDNGNNEKSLFELHLRPCTFPQLDDTGNKKRTVRIYFYWDNALKKVIVGWIGKHPFIPET